MKKFFRFFVVVATMCVSVNVLAGIKILPRQMTTQEVDSLYEKAPFIANSLEKERRTIIYDGDARIRLFIGRADANTVNMCTIEMPRVMESQLLSVQLIVNGRQEFIIPIKLSYQIYDKPKYINGKIVVRAFVGMDNPEEAHFYVVVSPNGSGYDTEVVSK